MVIHGAGGGLTLLRGGSQVLEQIASEHLLFVPSSSPNSPHRFLCVFLTHIQTRLELLSLWPSRRLCDSWTCCPPRLMWHWLRGGCFLLAQCMLVGAGCFLSELPVLLECQHMLGFIFQPCRNHKYFSVQPPLYNAENNVHSESNTKRLWILCVHMWRCTSPVNSIYFRMKGHTLASELLLFSQLRLWMFQSHRKVSLGRWAHLNLQPQSEDSTGPGFKLPSCHSHCGLCFSAAEVELSSYRRSKSLPIPSTVLAPATALLGSTTSPCLSHINKYFKCRKSRK